MAPKLREYLLNVYHFFSFSSPTEQPITSRGLFQAVRSYLHFSQLSAWYSSTKGLEPKNVLYRITIPGENFSTKFASKPIEHFFPPACKYTSVVSTTVYQVLFVCFRTVKPISKKSAFYLWGHSWRHSWSITWSEYAWLYKNKQKESLVFRSPLFISYLLRCSYHFLCWHGDICRTTQQFSKYTLEQYWNCY